MNRPIKYRVWSKELNRFIQHDKDAEGREGYNLGEFALTPDGTLCFYESEDGGMRVQAFDDVVVQFFTGLTDKNGKEIYEGDVLGDEYGSRAVFYDGDCFVVQLSKSETGSVKWYMHKRPMEVIGNIYENPNLLDHD